MINLTDKSLCCGCTACASICVHKAITMEPDGLGFMYPKIDLSKCTNCGLCEKVCEFNNDYDTSLNLEQPEIYGARHKDIHEVETSRSGAAFIAISDWILEQGGIVYGVGYNNHFHVVHKRAITKEERNEFKGSKYVQSDLTDIFIQVKNDLKNGKVVLFSGTPCQTAGLNSYIGKRLRDKLYLVDIICHGVPGPYIFKDYISYIEKKGPISIFNFRDKNITGWNSHIESYKYATGKIKESNIFTYLFQSCNTHRSSCFKCPYTNFNRPSDFTLGDYWGWERVSKTFNIDNKGCSLLILNTEKAIKLFEIIKDNLILIKSSKELCLQGHLKKPTVQPKSYHEFQKYYIENGFNKTLYKYGNISLKYKITNKINRIIKLLK